MKLQLKKLKRITRTTRSIRFSKVELALGTRKARKWASGNFSDFVRAAVRNYKPTKQDLEQV
jgi:hypothetical protein